MILKSKNYILLSVSIISLLAIIFSSLSCITITIKPSANKEPAGTTQEATGKTRPHPPVRTGEMILGKKVDVVSQSIGSEGGGITISKQGDVLDGFSIGIPPKSYSDSRTFKVSYTPINGQTFGDDFIPASPLITVDNGGGCSDELIYVKVPVQIPDGYFAMGFLYDSNSRQLEGMPMLAQDADSITVGTQHFSDFLIAMVEMVKLKDTVDSGFRPGADDWQFENVGSYISPGGHCEGQSTAAMWYYCVHPDGKDAFLYGRYDNNGKSPETPNLWKDDSWGYRFCSIIQEDIDADMYAYSLWPGLAGRAWQNVNNKWQWTNVRPLISDSTTLNLFTFAIQMTGEPQQIGLQSDAGGGHSIICYKVVKGTLYVADPNYPANTERMIELVNGTFKPYNSGANREEIEAGKGKNFEHVIYKAKSTIISWDKIAQRWAEFKNGTIGDDKFPQYQILISNGTNSVPLIDGYTSDSKAVRISAQSPIGCYVIRDGTRIDNAGNIELLPGKNLLGIYIVGKVQDKWKYVDFKYVTVNYNNNPDNYSLEPEVTQGVPETWCSFKIVSSENLEGKFFYWDFGDGSEILQTRDLGTTDHVFHKGGNFNIIVTIRDKNDKEIGKATGQAIIVTTVEGTVRVDSPPNYSIRNAYAVDNNGKEWHLYILPVSKAYLLPGHYTAHYSYVLGAPNQPDRYLEFTRDFDVPSVGTWELDIAPEK
jgi:hypothetical protein